MSSESTATSLPTGIAFLDQSLGDGPCGQGLYGILGPTGVGKTTLGVQIAVNGARRLAAAGAHGLWVFVSMEERPRHIQERAYSYAAAIPLESMRSVSSPDDLHGSGSDLEYEQRRATELRSWFPQGGSERERFCAAQRLFRDHLRIVDGQRVYYSMGVVPSLLEQAVMAFERADIAGIVIDKIEIAAGLHREARQLHAAEESRVIAQAVRECRTMLSRVFDCPVWLLHALDGDALTWGPAARQDHTYAMGCRQMAEYLNACFVFGTRDYASHRCLLHCTKGPTPDGGGLPAVLRYDPDFAMLVETPDYWADGKSGRIISRRAALFTIDNATHQLVRELAGQVPAGGDDNDRPG